MTPDQAAELAAVARTSATSLVARVHTERPEVIWAHLAGLSPAHLIATTVVLAAMVPLTAAPDELLAWIESAPAADVLHESPDRSPAPMSPMVETDLDEVVVIDDDTVLAARRVVAAHATTATECRELLAMLGIGIEVEAAA